MSNTTLYGFIMFLTMFLLNTSDKSTTSLKRLEMSSPGQVSQSHQIHFIVIVMIVLYKAGDRAELPFQSFDSELDHTLYKLTQKTTVCLPTFTYTQLFWVI